MYQAIRRLFGPLTFLPYDNSERIEGVERLLKRPIIDSVCLGGGTLINTGPFLARLEHAQRRYPCTFAFGTGVYDPRFLDGEEARLLPPRWVDALNRSWAASVRGPLSAALLAEAGLPNVRVIGDPALSILPADLATDRNRGVIGVNVGVTAQGMWGNTEQLFTELLRLCRHLIAQGWRIRLFPVWNKDLPLTRQLAQSLGGRAKVMRHDAPIRSTMKRLAECDVFVGMKLHSVILAAAAHTPTIMLEYRPKCRDFMASIGRERYTLRIHELCSEHVLSLIEEIMSSPDSHRRQTAHRVAQYRSLQRQESLRILEHLASLP